MPIDLRKIVDSQKKALALVEDPEKREALERFLESSGPLVEAAARDAIHELIEEMNDQLAPHSRIRLVQEGSKVLPEVVFLADDIGRRRTVVIDGDSISKVLVRMPSEVKTKAAEAAQKAGTSLNGWTVSPVNGACGSPVSKRSKSMPTSFPQRLIASIFAHSSTPLCRAGRMRSCHGCGDATRLVRFWRNWISCGTSWTTRHSRPT